MVAHVLAQIVLEEDIVAIHLFVMVAEIAEEEHTNVVWIIIAKQNVQHYNLI
jgi:hypothetical protein